MLSKASGQLKTVLADQSSLAGVGNAYSDEVLWAARLSPFKAASRLNSEEVARLYEALTDILRSAVERSLGQAAKELKDAKRAGMSVHGRAGQACPEVWRHGQGGLPVQPELPVLPGMPDGREGPGRPPPVEVVEVTAIRPGATSPVRRNKKMRARPR